MAPRPGSKPHRSRIPNLIRRSRTRIITCLICAWCTVFLFGFYKFFLFTGEADAAAIKEVAAARWEAVKSVEEKALDADEVAFIEFLTQIQFPSYVDPDTHRTVAFSYGGEGWTVGTGWVYEHMLHAFTYAISTNRTLIIHSNDAWYLARDACPLGSYLCYLNPISSIDEKILPLNGLGRRATQTCSNEDQHVTFDYYPGGDSPEEQRKLANCPTCKYMSPFNDNIPWRFRARGRMWFKAQLLRFLFHPRESILRLVRREQAKWDRTQLIIGMHVRHGDKVKGDYREAQAHALTEYMTIAEKFRARYGVSQIFISTDDASILKNTSLAAYPDWKFQFDPNEYRVEDGSGLRMIEHRDFNRTAEGTNAIKNLALLGSCDFLIGSVSSFFTRQAWRLQMGEGRMLDWGTVDQDPWTNFPYEGNP